MNSHSKYKLLSHCFVGFLRFPWILTFSVTEVTKCSGLNQTVAHSYKSVVPIPMVSNFGMLNRLLACTKLASGSFHSSCSIMATNAARTPQPNVFTPPSQHLDILQKFLLLYSSAFVVLTSVCIFGVILTIKSSFCQTVDDITWFSQLTQVLFCCEKANPQITVKPTGCWPPKLWTLFD